MKYLRFILFLGFIALCVQASALTKCRHCKYLIETNTLVCPKCLRYQGHPFLPPRSKKATVIVRNGKDAFIRHPQAQNMDWRHEKNAGKDPYGAIGYWGYPTSLRYLIWFNIPEAFYIAGKTIDNFKLYKATLILKSVQNQPNKRIPIIVYPLTKPFTEGIGQLNYRKSETSGCTWLNSSPLIPWQQEGGDYNSNIYSTGTLHSGKISQSEIDVTAIIQHRIDNYRTTGKWEDKGMIIMNNPNLFCEESYINIFSFEAPNPKSAAKILTPELYLE